MSDSVASPRGVFLLESFAPVADSEVSSEVAERVSAACAELRRARNEVTYLGVLVVPDDELAFHVFVAADADVVLDASRRAGLRIERVVRSMAICAVDGPATGRHRATPSRPARATRRS